MVIVETCPVCGGDLQNLEIATYPPIPVKECYKCGWRWEGKREDVVRVPFVPPAVPAVERREWVGPECCRNCSNNPNNGGSGICNCMLPYMTQTGISAGDAVVTTAVADLEAIQPAGYTYVTTNVVTGL